MISKETKEIVKDLKEIEGSCRGVSIETPLEYVYRNYVEEVLVKIESELRDLNIPTRKEVDSLEKYPLGYMTATHLVVREVIGCDYEEVKRMGYSLPQVSFIVKSIARYFISPEKTFRKAPEYWRRHFTVGDLVPAEMKDDYMILQLKDFKTHPIDCKLFEGYFMRMVEYTIKTENISSKETKCMHKGDDYHEYVISWD